MNLSTRLFLSVFLTGASVMIVELVGSRVLAPTLGTSTLVWTSLIGLILGALSLGYWWGGELADKNPDRNMFATILIISSALILLIPIMAPMVLVISHVLLPSIALRAIIVTLILFCPAGVVLGMASPYAARLLLTSVEASGKTVGRLYAFSTIGSIVGTFLAGFVLLTIFRTNTIFFLVAGVLAVTSLLTISDRRNLRQLAYLCVAAAVILLAGNASLAQAIDSEVQTFPTKYQDVNIFPAVDDATDREILVWQTDPFVWQSAIFPDEPETLVFDYLKGYNLYQDILEQSPSRMLMLGGAGFVYPRHVLATDHDVVFDVVEIDDELEAIAREHFMLKEYTNLHSYAADARTFLMDTEHEYDVIFGDAYTAVYSIPYHLTTVEALELVRTALDDEGLFVVNVISAIEGDNAAFLEHFVYTLEEVFPSVIIRQTEPDRNSEEVQNLLVFASKQGNSLAVTDEHDALFPSVDLPIPHDTTLLTDQHAPIEHLTRSFFR